MISILWSQSELLQVLERASLPDKTVIITTLNAAWAEPNSMVDMFLESFDGGDNIKKLVNNLVIVALDQSSYDRCESIHQHCYQLRTEGVDFSGEKVFLTDDYLKMMWRRIEFLGAVLEQGYSFLFTVSSQAYF